MNHFNFIFKLSLQKRGYHGAPSLLEGRKKHFFSSIDMTKLTMLLQITPDLEKDIIHSNSPLIYEHMEVKGLAGVERQPEEVVVD